MPAAFDKCVANGGKVITHDIGTDKYIHVCYLGGKGFVGEVKTKKQSASAKSRRRKHKPSAPS